MDTTQTAWGRCWNIIRNPWVHDQELCHRWDSTASASLGTPQHAVRHRQQLPRLDVVALLRAGIVNVLTLVPRPCHTPLRTTSSLTKRTSGEAASPGPSGRDRTLQAPS